MDDIIRRNRQLEYERNLDKWAEMGKKRLKKLQLKRKCKEYTGYPLWYTEFSLLQLKELKQLKDKMFKDNEEQTTFRTLQALSDIGMITDIVKVESRLIKKLVNKFNTEPIKFLCEIYKAISGNYFENEKFKYYNCTERIILSGIAFLELPKIILALHKRLPPILDIKLPPKPKPPEVKKIKKMDCPYEEKLVLPPDWRAYQKAFEKWFKNVSVLPRPVVILPEKEKNIHETIIEEEKKVISNKLAITEEKNLPQINSIEPIQKSLNMQEKTEHDITTKNHSQEMLENNPTCMHELSSLDKNKQNLHSFSLKNWTNPLSPCPFKYRKLMEKVGPVNTDEEFFKKLGYEPEKKCFLAGRENLSVNMQSYLLGLETDLFKVTDAVDKLACEVKKIAKGILEDEPHCDTCCACRETQKSHLESRLTKAPHMLIDSVVTSRDNKTQVIGATTMNSPVPSISSFGEPPYIPSTEKLVKNMILTGTVTTIDGERLKQVEGFTKAIEHIPHEVLLPDLDVDDIKNVPPCKCSKDSKNEEENLQPISDNKNRDLCFGKKYRPDEAPTYNCGEFKKKDIAQDDYDGVDNFVEKFVIDDECGCGIDFKKCIMDGENEYENSLKSSKTSEHILEEKVKIKVSNIECESCRICKSCGRKVEAKYEDTFSRYKTAKNKKIGKMLTSKCSCNSLSEFLQFDLTKINCNKSKQNKNSVKGMVYKKKRFSKRESEKIYQKKVLDSSRNMRKFSDNKMNKIKQRKASVSILSSEENEKEYKEPIEINDSLRRESVHLKNSTINESKSLSIQNDCNIHKPEQAGPFGLRTSSEEELPVKRTVAYLTSQHPTDHPAGQIPIGKGKRGCRCRENRNNRKTLKYNIGGLACDQEEEDRKDLNLSSVIEGVTWLTPEPSIRRSDEYIPEYELYDSPYENLCATSKKVENKCGGKKGNYTKEDNTGERIEGGKNNVNKSRSQDWQNSFNDPYLTDMFIKKHEKLSCHKKCSKFPKADVKPKKLKVMNAVCECKYERKIVEEKEGRKKWFDRQSRLKLLKKEPVIHISDISRSVLTDKKSAHSELPEYHCETRNTHTKCYEIENEPPENKNLGPPQIVISAVTMQTPVCTPVQSRTYSKSIIKPIYNEVMNPVTPVLDSKKLLRTIDASQDKKIKDEYIHSDRNRNSDYANELINEVNLQKEDPELKQVEKREYKIGDETKINGEELKNSKQKVITKFKKRISFFDRLEENLKFQMHEELNKMVNEDYVSLKLPKFHKMPQLLYWISYRARGMKYTDAYKKELTENSKKKWIELHSRIKRKIGPKPLGVKRKDISKLNFDSAIYWKKRIAKKKMEYYTELRHEVLNLGRDAWPSMEFGKFPDIIFKQAYFTYLPSREKDAHVVGLWF